MSSLQQRIVEMLRTPQLACLATITQEGKPWVRYVFCEGGEDMSISFATFVSSRKVVQIKNNPEVHLTCAANNPGAGPYLQIQGVATFYTDKAKRYGFWKSSLKKYFQGPDDPGYGVVVIEPYRIELCSPGLLGPEVWVMGRISDHHK